MFYSVSTGVLPVRGSLHGETVKFATFIPASSKKEAEALVRSEKRFRRQIRQSGLDPKSVPLSISRSIKAEI